MDALKLVALDEDDLKIVSAHVQDAVLKVGELAYAPKARRLVLTMNRFAWEESGGFFRKRHQRRKAVLSFDRVLSAKISGIRRDRPDEVLSLLALRFVQGGEGPAGLVELVFSGGGAIRLAVECIEARLADTGGAWETPSKPVHRP
ncbi:MAG: DUF2948 family protein [Rhizobiaceae bacterium]|nr:DUF2948 family protein [Rhizobiaceae bacterium]